MDRIFKKTGSLFATAAESGAVLSGAEEHIVQAVREFGSNLGIAFQIVDDVLDFEGSAAEIGKPVGSDLASGVLTLPALMLVEQYPDDNPVVAVCKDIDREENLKRAVDMVRNSGVMASVYAEADALRAKAIAVAGGVAGLGGEAGAAGAERLRAGAARVATGGNAGPAAERGGARQGPMCYISIYDNSHGGSHGTVQSWSNGTGHRGSQERGSRA